MNRCNLYSTDASVYENVPKDVEYPRITEDTVKLIHKAKRKGLSLIFRGGGTSLAGQCVGNGVVVDTSRYMSDFITQNQVDYVVEQQIWVQPGVVLDELNDFLRPMGLHFPIDISTSSRCTIGGMFSNNAAGSHSIFYGTTREYVTEIEAVLHDGSLVHYRPLTHSELEQKKQMLGFEGDIYRNVFQIIDSNIKSIIDAYPDPLIIRRNTGYALDIIANGQPWKPDGELFNLTKLVSGSEGTLCFVSALRLKLVPLPASKSLVCVHFDSLQKAFDIVPRLLNLKGIAAIEMIDSEVLNAAQKHKSQSINKEWVIGNPAAVLVCEFFETIDFSANQLALLTKQLLQSELIGYAWSIMSEENSKKVWALRKAGLGLLMGVQELARPVAVIEDSAIPVEKLGRFYKDIQNILKKCNVRCVCYGHVSVGLIHFRPKLDLSDANDRDKFKFLAKHMALLVKNYNGSLSGEHGDGLLRAPFLRDFFGDHVYELIRQVKMLFDPSNIFNSGKLIGDIPIDMNLRHQPTGRLVEYDRSGFLWENSGGFGQALSRCNGSGTCRQKVGVGAMCPTFQATGDEMYSPRGRANLLRQAFSKIQSQKTLKDPFLKEAMDTCLSCKACKNECPSGVDIAAMKAEYLHRRGGYFLKRLLLTNHRVFLLIAGYLPKVVRAFISWCLQTKFVMQSIGLKRAPPCLAQRVFSKKVGFVLHNKKQLNVDNGLINALRFLACLCKSKSFFNTIQHEVKADRIFSRLKAVRLRKLHCQQTMPSKEKMVVLIVDSYLNQLEPNVVETTILLLNKLGYQVTCYIMQESIRLLISEGYLNSAKKALNRLMIALKTLDNIPIIGLEPAEILLLRDEAPKLLKDWSRMEINKVVLLEEFLLTEFEAGNLPKVNVLKDSLHIAVHPHCHARSAGLNTIIHKLLENWMGLVTHSISTGCCGMGGVFGYKFKSMSEKIFSNNIKLNDQYAFAVANGASCRAQFRDLSSLAPTHIAQLLFALI